MIINPFVHLISVSIILIDIKPIGNFTSTVDLSLTGLPAGASSNLPLTVASNDTATVTLSNLAGVSAGNYPMTLTLTETGGSLTKNVSLNFVKKENAITNLPDKAVEFSNTGQIHISKSNSDFDFGDDKDFSIEFWMKTTSTSGDDAIISDKNWNSGNNKGWVVAMQSGKLVFNIGSGSNRIDIGTGWLNF